MGSYFESQLSEYLEAPLDHCAPAPSESDFESYLEQPLEACALPPTEGTLGTPAAQLHRTGWFDEDTAPPPFGFAQLRHISELTADNPSDEPCAFCDPPLNAQEVPTFDFAVSVASGHIAVKAALGMMRPAYLLGVTKEHVTSFAQLDVETLREVDEVFTEVEQRTIARLGLSHLARNQIYESYIRLEHGSDNVDSCGLGAGACVTHAHQHLIPATPNTADLMLDKAHDINWRKLDSYEELSLLRGEPYLYVGHEGSHYAAVNPGVVSQWGRRVIAKEDRRTDWDWALSPRILNFMWSLHALGWQLPPGKTSMFGGMGVTLLETPVDTYAQAPLLPAEEFNTDEVD